MLRIPTTIATSSTTTTTDGSSSHSLTSAATPLPLELIIPDIYFTKDFIAWNEQNLRKYDFKHIIIIDKHIQELYYPANNFKLIAQLPHSFGLDFDDYDIGCTERFPPGAGDATVAADAGDILNLGNDFETIVLNFGQEAFLSNVLPNCYRAVRFIRKVQKSGGKLLIIDCNGGEQKCVTIVVAYLMYKHNSSFREAFSRLKQYYGKADLDRFYANQLYEYEPILQVQRASACGQSCSRALRAAHSKRKRHNQHEVVFESDVVFHNANDIDLVDVDANANFQHVNAYEDANSLFNPLTHFKPNNKDENENEQQQQQQQNVSMIYQGSQQQQAQQNVAFTYAITGAYALNSIDDGCHNDHTSCNSQKLKQARLLNTLDTNLCDNEDVAME